MAADRVPPGTRIQVCFALPDRVFLRDMVVEQGTRLIDALNQSGLREAEPKLDLASCKLGVHGKLKAPDTVLRDGDRIEVYRPLLADPKDARRRRAVKAARRP